MNEETTTKHQMTAAKVLVDTLGLHGVERAFCVPGESYLPVMDCLYDDPVFRMVTCRHEGGAAFMALADAKMTGRAGVCFASRGPGATNAAIAVHAADQGAHPLVLLLGQVERSKVGRGAIQEMDFAKTFADMSKAVMQVDLPERIGEIVARAFRVAESGTPGPVVVGLPTDVLEAPVVASAVAPRARTLVRPADGDVAAVGDALSRAERPAMIVGGRAAAPAAREALRACSETWQVPVFASFEHQDVFSNDHPHYAGELGIRPPPGVQASVREADLIVAVGTRLGDKASLGFTVPGPGQRLIHVYPDEARIGANFPTELGIVADAAPFLEALAGLNAPPAPAGRAAWIERVRSAYVEAARLDPRPARDGGIDFGHVIQAMIDHLPDDAIITSDAGSFASWMHLHYPFKSSQILLGSEAGAMGMGIPAAVAAALRHPNRRVLALVGDGGALMTGYELATAMREKVRNLCIVVSNNASYGTIRFHQETHFPGRPYATELVNPDFAALAEAFGARGMRIERPEEAAPVLAEALAQDRPVVIDVRTSLENVDAQNTIGNLRERRLSGMAAR